MEACLVYTYVEYVHSFVVLFSYFAKAASKAEVLES